MAIPPNRVANCKITMSTHAWLTHYNILLYRVCLGVPKIFRTNNVCMDQLYQFCNCNKMLNFYFEIIKLLKARFVGRPLSRKLTIFILITERVQPNPAFTACYIMDC